MSIPMYVQSSFQRIVARELSAYVGKSTSDLLTLSPEAGSATVNIVGTSATVNGNVINAFGGKNLTVLGRTGTGEAGSGVLLDGNYSGRSFYMTGTTFEFSWRSRGTNTARFMILVDGLPLSLTPYAPTGTTSGNTRHGLVTFATDRGREITVLAARTAAWGAFRFPATATVLPATPKPLITVVGASFSAGFTTGENTSALQGLGLNTARQLGVDVQIAAQEGTGYLTAGGYEVYGAQARIDRAFERTPMLGIIEGSGNDRQVYTTPEAYETAVRATIDAYAAAGPGVPWIMTSVPPRAAEETIDGVMAQMNHVLRRVAAEHPAVIGFVDMVGMPGPVPPAAFSSAKTDYKGGEPMTRLGSVWRVAPQILGDTSGASSVPGVSERFEPVTWAYTGSGKAGATTGDGTRDVLLSNDGTHPTVAGLIALSRLLAAAIRDILANA